MPELSHDDRDHRLSQALDLLAQSVASRRNGALPLVAVTCLMLSGALLVSLVNSPEKKPAIAATAVAAPGGQPAQPQADFELSGTQAGTVSGTANVASGQEPQR